MTLQTAIFAMGCFWCSESAFKEHKTHALLPGIVSIEVGYAGGVTPFPTYSSHVGYKEAIKIVFDPAAITYESLLNLFWKNIDPFDGGGQFYDRGPSYQTAIFFADATQKNLALLSKEKWEKKLGKSFKTEILQATTFYKAEDYHQNFQEKSPERYENYRCASNRDVKLKQIWG